MRAVIVSTILLLLTIGIPFAPSLGAESDKLIIDFDAIKLNFHLNLQSGLKRVMFDGTFFLGPYLVNDWEVEQYTPTQYRIRHKSWGDFFWNIDCEQKKIWRMKGANLNAAGSKAEFLDGIVVKDIQRGNVGAVQTISILLNMSSPQLFLDLRTGAMRVIAGGAVVSDTDAWEARRVSKDIYHFRFKQRQHDFWQIDMTFMTLDHVTEGSFGFPGGDHSHRPEIVRMEGPNSSPAQNEIPVDLGMTRFGGKNPKSAWQESEKALNAAVLGRDSYDVLVVPFQVGGYAIDRVDRSLMTRYLVRDLELSTNLKFPSPTMVARALGEACRTFDDHDVFQLANKLGVKQIIRGYVGHDLNERMNVTLVVQTRNEEEYFSSSTKTEKYSWHDIAISDERTPADAFVSIMHDISARLQIPKTPKKESRNYLAGSTPALPAELRGLVINSSSSPLVRAYYLQLLALLHPEESVSKEQLFERSLVVLRELSPRASDYKILKARALFHLYRRPAAVVVLSEPKGAKEKALSAVMDGNLQLLRKSINDIKTDLPRLIAQIELSDLLWQYSPDQARSEFIDSIIRQWPGWEKILARRLNHWDGWNVQSNLEVKKELDRLFPVAGFTAEDIVKSKMAIGEQPMDDDDVDFSVYNHYRRMMENQPEKLAVNELNGAVDRDVLDLMVSIGESNLLKKIRLRRMQALYDEMIKLVDRYSAIYGGHPEMAFLKALALYRIADSKQGQVQKNLREEADQIQRNVCYWSQGQTGVSSQRSCVRYNFYDADYPRRSYWQFSHDPAELTDRKYRGPQELAQRGHLSITRFDWKEVMNYELSLLYTQTGFSVLSSYYDKLQQLQMYEEAAALLEKNRHRFIGNSSRTSFFAQVAEQEGDVKRASSIYEEAIALQPNDWAPYQGLSSLLIQQGDFKTASKTALKYPLFSVAEDGRENPAIDTVALSNHAFHIGRNLWWSGATKEAKPLLQLSAGYDTGSGAEMWSGTFLALLDHDFQKAAQMSLVNAKRYNMIEAYGNYIELLHVMGYHDEAWAVLPQIQSVRYGVMNWGPVLLGLRMEGKTTEEQIQWLKKQPMAAFTSQDAVAFTFLVHTFDREPDMNLSEKLQSVREQIEASKTELKAPVSQKPKQQSPTATSPNEKFLKRLGAPIGVLPDGYPLLKKHQFSDAYEKLRFSGGWITKDMFSFAIPYFVWSAAKSGRVSEVESYLAEYKKVLGDDFDYYLSQAFLSDSKKDHQEAIRHLERARYHLQHVNGIRLFPAWYQLAETCEWLYEDSKFEGYRELLLKFVRLRQTIRPMDSWAYAFEAKYTRSDPDRTRALAITLYLDRQSERIAHFSGNDKSKAIEWLKKNNPFLQPKQKVPGLET
jgi:tetratricopeptide (TPR) repeat protein